MEASTAKQAYDLVGGRLVHLKLFVGVHHGASFEGMPSFLSKNNYLLIGFTEVKQKLFRDAFAEVLRAQILPTAGHHELGSQIINALLDGQRLTEEDYYYGRFGFGVGHDLLESNVFAVHLDSGLITFQSRLMENYCEQERKEWRTEKKA